MNPIEPASVLGRARIFADLSESELAALAHRTIIHHMLAGEQIFAEGEPCEGLFVVESGEVKIFKTAASGREQLLTVEHAGDSFAELPVFDGGPYPASAAAMTDGTLLMLRKRDFRAVILEHPEAGLKVLAAAGRRLRRLVSLIEELSFTTVRGRLAMQLVRIAKTSGEVTARGTEITLPANQDLASSVGTVRELVSRNLARLQVEGLIRIEGKHVIIADLTALAELGEQQS